MDNLITRTLDAYISRTEEERLPDGKYHPSSMFGPCLRSVVLELRGIEKSNPPDAQAKRRFRLGHMIHEMVQKAGVSGPEIGTFYPEFEIDISDLNLAGHGDALFAFPVFEDEWYVLEVKSVNGKAFKYGAKPDHIKQGQSYAAVLRTQGGWQTYLSGDTPPVRIKGDFISPLGDKLKGLLLVYIEKEALLTAEHYFPYDPQWEVDLEDKIKELDVWRLERPDELPPPLPLERGKPSWYYNYCGFKGSGQCCYDKEKQEEVLDHEW